MADAVPRSQARGMKPDYGIPRAPAGWGYLPGAPLTLQPVSRESLPDLPLLRFVPKERQKSVVVNALADFGQLQQVTPAMVKTRYGLHSTSAATALDMARLLHNKNQCGLWRGGRQQRTGEPCGFK